VPFFSDSIRPALSALQEKERQHRLNPAVEPTDRSGAKQQVQVQ
jgi:hypothetical protein